MFTPTELKSKFPRDHRLDILKAISICLVLFLHLAPLRFSSTTEEFSIYTTVITKLVDGFNAQVCLLAVPIFIIVSLYIYFLKSHNDFNYTKKRILRLGEIYLFWTLVQIAIYLLIYNQENYPEISFTWKNFLKIIIQGGPSLPLVEHSVFYFLFALIILTLLSYCYQSWLGYCSPQTQKNINLICITSWLAYFEFMTFANITIPYWRLDSFLILIPVAYCLVNYQESIFRFRHFHLLGFLIFSLQDIVLLLLDYELGAYGRASVVFGAIYLFILVCSRPWGEQKNNVVSFLSKYSLGIFAIHKYWQLLLYTLSFKLGFYNRNIVLLGSTKLDISAMILAIIMVLVTLVTVYWWGMTQWKKCVC